MAATKKMVARASLKVILLLQLCIVPASSSALVRGCSARDIVISQGKSNELEYQVEIVNKCDRSVGDVHIDCGAFSSLKLVNPSVFRRLSPGDCIVLDGGTIGPGTAVRFVYMSDRLFPMRLKNFIT